MSYATLDRLLELLLYTIVAGFVLAFVRLMLPVVRRRLLRERLRRTGVPGVARVVEVSVLEEGSEGGQRLLFGFLPITTQRNHNGTPTEPVLATYRILLRYSPPGHGELVADAEQQLTTAQLDHLTPDRSVDIRYDPAHPDRVVLDPTGLRRALHGPSSAA